MIAGADLARLELLARDGRVPIEALAFICPRRAGVRCECGRNAVQAEADALAELDAPCPDCGRSDGRTFDGPPAPRQAAT